MLKLLKIQRKNSAAEFQGHNFANKGFHGWCLPISYGKCFQDNYSIVCLGMAPWFVGFFFLREQYSS